MEMLSNVSRNVTSVLIDNSVFDGTKTSQL